MKPVQGYLLLYNLLQFAGWSIIFAITVLNLCQNVKPVHYYDSTELILKIFQTAAILEIVHAMLGFVRSPVFTTIIQVYSRVSVVWLIAHKIHSSRESVGVPMFLFAWSLTEIVRYSYYALAIVNAVPKFLVYLRYTLFIVLYPLGALGELFTIYAGLHEVAVKKHFTLEMPNCANIAFSFWWYLVFFMLIYIPGFPKMYLHMFAQRKKVLCVEASKKQE